MWKKSWLKCIILTCMYLMYNEWFLHINKLLQNISFSLKFQLVQEKMNLYPSLPIYSLISTSTSGDLTLNLALNKFVGALSVSMWKKSWLKCIILTCMYLMYNEWFLHINKLLQNISFSLKFQLVQEKMNLYPSLPIYSLIST